MKFPRKRCRLNKKRGAALTELLFVLPILILIIFGSIEATNLLHLQQAVTESAYDGAVRASRLGATQSQVQTNITDLLAARNIQATVIEVGNGATPVENIPSGQLFNVFVKIDTASHLISPTMFANFTEIEVRMVARKQ